MKMKDVVKVWLGLHGLLALPIPPLFARMISKRMDAIADAAYEHDVKMSELREEYKVPNPVPIGYQFPARYLEAYHDFCAIELSDVNIKPIVWAYLTALKTTDGKPIQIPPSIIDALSPIIIGEDVDEET